jgi:hypothetical protein
MGRNHIRGGGATILEAPGELLIHFQAFNHQNRKYKLVAAGRKSLNVYAIYIFIHASHHQVLHGQSVDEYIYENEHKNNKSIFEFSSTLLTLLINNKGFCQLIL